MIDLFIWIFFPIAILNWFTFFCLESSLFADDNTHRAKTLIVRLLFTFFFTLFHIDSKKNTDGELSFVATNGSLQIRFKFCKTDCLSCVLLSLIKDAIFSFYFGPSEWNDWIRKEHIKRMLWKNCNCTLQKFYSSCLFSSSTISNQHLCNENFFSSIIQTILCLSIIFAILSFCLFPRIPLYILSTLRIYSAQLVNQSIFVLLALSQYILIYCI